MVQSASSVARLAPVWSMSTEDRRWSVPEGVYGLNCPIVDSGEQKPGAGGLPTRMRRPIRRDAGCRPPPRPPRGSTVLRRFGAGSPSPRGSAGQRQHVAIRDHALQAPVKALGEPRAVAQGPDREVLAPRTLQQGAQADRGHELRQQVLLVGVLPPSLGMVRIVGPIDRLGDQRPPSRALAMPSPVIGSVRLAASPTRSTPPAATSIRSVASAR